MKKREITIVTDEFNVQQTKEILLDIKLSNPSIQFSPPIKGTIGDLVLLTIKVQADSFEQMLEIILRRRLKLFTKEDQEKAKLNLKQKDAEDRIGYRYVDSFVNIATPSINEIFKKSLEDYMKEGNYRALIAIYKDPKKSPEEKKKAKKVLPIVIVEVIQHLYSRSISSTHFADEGINKLMIIAEDKVLDAEGYQKSMRDAALKAIRLCTIYSDNLYKLIKIANNSKMPKEACVKAAAYLGQTIFEQKEKFYADLADAEKKLNIRWLETVFELVSNSLNDRELSGYKKITNHILQLRNRK